jgi:hypothetical protein
MRTRNFVCARIRPFGMALIASALLAAGIAVARNTVTPFTLTETTAATVDQGQWSFLPSGNIHVRGRVNDYLDTASDPRINGQIRAVTNANLDSNWTGPTWGSFHGEIGEGVWDGTWNGNFNFQTGSGYYDAVGHGSGAFQGLQSMEHCVYVYGVGTCTGRILDTKGQ